MKFIFSLFVFSAVLATTPSSRADAGVFTGNGQSLHQISSKTVQLVSIDVSVILGRGPFLFDGSVRGMDRAEYLCKFVLRSQSEKPEDVEVGFPVDSQFAGGNETVSPADSADWILNYAFIARDEKDTYHVEFVRRKPTGGEGEFGSVFVWKMHFDPKEMKTLSVRYQIPISMGLVTTEKQGETTGVDPGGGFHRPLSGALGIETLDLGMLETAGYITSTGSSWAGNVESAKFTVETDLFERYLNHRGVIEEIPPEVVADKENQRESPFPITHPWWFRKIAPDGWKPVEGGIQWSYKDYKPKETLSIRYYMTEFPQSRGDVDIFASRILKRMDKNDSPSVELSRAKEVLLATYGKEPEDETVKAYVSRQLWYTPRKDFSLANLSDAQRAVLAKMDAGIAKAKDRK